MAVGMTVFITSANMNVVGVALPRLGHEFQVPPATVQWVVLAYVLPLVALGLPAGRWADGIDRRSAFALAVIGTGTASIGVALATGLPMVLAMRALQGMFGALISSLVLAVLARSVRPDAMGRAVGLVAALGPLGGAVGPPVGGLLIEFVGWRAVFLMEPPVCLLALWLGWRSIPSDDKGLRAPRPSWVMDTVLLGAALVALLLALQAFDPPDPLPVVGAVLVLAAGLGILVWSRREGSRGAVAILVDPVPRRWLTALWCGGVVSGGLGLLTPFYLSDGLDVSSAVTGLTMLAFPAGMVVFAPIGGACGDRWGHRSTALAGSLVMLAGAVSLVPASTSWEPLDIAVRLALVGAGSGLLAGPAQAAVLASVRPGNEATAGAFSAVLLNLGFTIGPPLSSFGWRLGGGDPTAMTTGYAIPLIAAVVALLAVTLLTVSRPRRLDESDL